MSIFHDDELESPEVTSDNNKEVYSSGGKLSVIVSAYKHVGARDNQEDGYAVPCLDQKPSPSDGVLAVVADGMGGLAFGEEASSSAITAFLREYTYNNQADINERLLRAIQVANVAVFDLAFNHGEDHSLGTTLIAATVAGDLLHWISAGDSRIYLYRDNQLKQLTTDHVYANQLAKEVAGGRMSAKEAKNHPEKDHLTSYLGLAEIPELSFSSTPLPLAAGDRVILCSDGLFNTYPEDAIAALLDSAGADPAPKLVEATLECNNPYQDNVTVVVLTIV